MMKQKTPLSLIKYLSSCNQWPRRECETLIISGKIKVNGKKITDISYKLNPPYKVEYSGRILGPQGRIVLALNKPKGYITTASDDLNRRTVMDLVEGIDQRLFPVGRLDKDSKGLLIMTNDGDLAYKITHPKFKIPKTYEVTVNDYIDDKVIKKIYSGVKIDGKKLVPSRISVIRRSNSFSIIKITVAEGRKRIIRRLFAKLKFKVKELSRTRIGDLRLDRLKKGRYRILGKNDIKKLVKMDTK